MAKVGLFQFSDHEATTELAVTIYDGDMRELWRGRIDGHGTSSGGEEALAYVPVVGNLSYDKALKVAMTQSVLAALREVISKVNETF